MLESVKGNRAAAASRLGVDPVTLNRKLKRWEQANFSQARHEGEQAGGENLKEQVTRLREEIRRQADRHTTCGRTSIREDCGFRAPRPVSVGRSERGLDEIRI